MIPYPFKIQIELIDGQKEIYVPYKGEMFVKSGSLKFSVETKRISIPTIKIRSMTLIYADKTITVS